MVMLFVATFLLEHPAAIVPLTILVLVGDRYRVGIPESLAPALDHRAGIRLHARHLDALLPGAGGWHGVARRGGALRSRHGAEARDLSRHRPALSRHHDRRGVRLRAHAARRTVPRRLRAHARLSSGAGLPRGGARGGGRATLPWSRLHARQLAPAHRALRAGDRTGGDRRSAARRSDGLRPRGAGVQLGTSAHQPAAAASQRRPTGCSSGSRAR